MKPIRLACILLTVILLLSSCNIPGPSPQDTSAMSTSAALTVQAVLSPAAASEATQTLPIGSLATQAASTEPATATPTPVCKDSAINTAWTRDNVLYDVKAVNKALAPNKTFLMSWTFQNTGDCTWDSTYRMSYDSGTSLTSSVDFPILQPAQTAVPGGSVTVDVEMTAPATNGDYQAVWELRDGQGKSLLTFGVMLKVGSASQSLARPGNLRYTYDCTSGSVNISLFWVDASNDEDGYRIYRDGTKVAELASGTTSYSEIAPGSGKYDYTVAAFNSSGESPAKVVVNTSNCH